MGAGKSVLWLTITAFMVAYKGMGQPAANFKCSSSGQNATCRGLIDYTSKNSTSLGAIQRLFDVKHLTDILGANPNNLPGNATGSHVVGPGEVVRVAFPCKCGNGTGLSNHVPKYKIKGGDTLDGIARNVFSGVVSFGQIQMANNLSDPNKILAGADLWIPLPCSCDAVAGSTVVHYAHIVPAGSTVAGIAEEYGTTEQELLTLNGISDPKSLQAGQLLDVPLKACTSSVKNVSLDYPLLVPNSTYVYTANQCVKCKCDSANNYVLQCEASNLKPTKPWSVCPSLTCASANVSLGNVTSSSDSCNRTFCDYAGYNSRNISTTLATESFCPAPAPSPTGSGSPSPSGSGASRIALPGGLWTYLFIAIHLSLVSFLYLL